MERQQESIKVDEDGTVYRIDDGGSLAYRAQGARKSRSDWNGWVTDLWSMREAFPGAGEHSARIFGELDWYQIMDQAERLVD